MSMGGPYPPEWFLHPFKVGDLVEMKDLPGAVFEVVENCQDYDSTALSRIKFAGPRRGIPPRTVGRLSKDFRIRKMTVMPNRLVQANAMLVLAVFSEG